MDEPKCEKCGSDIEFIGADLNVNPELCWYCKRRNEYGKIALHCDKCYKQLQAENKQLKEQVEKLAGQLLNIDNYCRVNDIDLDQALKGE